VKALLILGWSKEPRLELIAEISCEEWRELVVQKKGV